MNPLFRLIHLRLFPWLLVFMVALSIALPAQADITPSKNGIHRVACSNVEQDFTKVTAGLNASDYWEGTPVNGTSKYVIDLFKNPAQSLTYNVLVPTRAENDTFPRTGGSLQAHAAIACYPTTSSNTRADYTLPSGIKVPKMQRGAETPLIGDSPASDKKWPLLVMSHGMGGSPLGDDYVQVIVRLAAEGYVVFAPFHADARYSRLRINNFSDYFYLLTNYAEVAEMQAMRPLGLKQGLDYFLGKSEYANQIDTDRIAGFGASLGGMAMMLTQGARMTTSWAGAERTIVEDHRYKAIVGYVPFSGYTFQPAFGDSNQGVKKVRVPYLGIGGTADIVAPISRTSEMISNLGGSKYFVTIEGMPHGFRVEDAPEIFAWTFAFLNAHLSRNQADRSAFDAIQNIPGGSNDVVQIRKTLGWGSRDELEVIEYFNPSLSKYFMTGRPDEIALIDSYLNLWARTGERYVAFRLDAPIGAPVCRIWANDGDKINTHFYSQSTTECDLLRAKAWAHDEGNVMRIYPAAATCPVDTKKIIRLFNQGTINHRYLSEAALSSITLGTTWQNDGVVFCAPIFEK